MFPRRAEGRGAARRRRRALRAYPRQNGFHA